MFGLGIWEIAVILVVGLLFLGPEKLPKVARKLGRGVREVRRAATEFQRSINTEIAEMEEQTKDATGVSEVRDIVSTVRDVKTEITQSKPFPGASIPYPEKAADSVAHLESAGGDAPERETPELEAPEQKKPKKTD